MSGIIIYKSKYGATKKYADWISEETGFETIEASKAKIEEVRKYDTIIVGGGIYASGISGLSFLKKHIKALSGKKIIVFCDGASPYDDDGFKVLLSRNMKEELGGVPCFYCRGAWDMDKMSAVDRNLCKMLKRAVAKKSPDEYEPWEAALMKAGESKCDWTDKAYILPILEELNK